MSGGSDVNGNTASKQSVPGLYGQEIHEVSRSGSHFALYYQERILYKVTHLEEDCTYLPREDRVVSSPTTITVIRSGCLMADKWF